LLKAVKNRQDNDECHGAHGNSGQRNARDHVDDVVRLFGKQIPARYVEWESFDSNLL
jgi:hypothetical protein